MPEYVRFAITNGTNGRLILCNYEDAPARENSDDVGGPPVNVSEKSNFTILGIGNFLRGNAVVNESGTIPDGDGVEQDIDCIPYPGCWKVSFNVSVLIRFGDGSSQTIGPFSGQTYCGFLNGTATEISEQMVRGAPSFAPITLNDPAGDIYPLCPRVIPYGAVYSLPNSDLPSGQVVCGFVQVWLDATNAKQNGNYVNEGETVYDQYGGFPAEGSLGSSNDRYSVVTSTLEEPTVAELEPQPNMGVFGTVTFQCICSSDDCSFECEDCIGAGCEPCIRDSSGSGPESGSGIESGSGLSGSGPTTGSGTPSGSGPPVSGSGIVTGSGSTTSGSGLPYVSGSGSDCGPVDVGGTDTAHCFQLSSCGSWTPGATGHLHPVYNDAVGDFADNTGSFTLNWTDPTYGATTYTVNGTDPTGPAIPVIAGSTYSWTATGTIANAPAGNARYFSGGPDGGSSPGVGTVCDAADYASLVGVFAPLAAGEACGPCNDGRGDSGYSVGDSQQSSRCIIYQFTCIDIGATSSGQTGSFTDFNGQVFSWEDTGEPASASALSYDPTDPMGPHVPPAGVCTGSGDYIMVTRTA